MSPSSFFFQSRQLVHNLNQQSLASVTGYCQIKLETSEAESHGHYLGLSQGRVVYLGDQPLSWDTLIACLERYNLRLRQSKAQALLQTLKRRATPDQQQRLGMLVNLLEKMKLSKLDEVIQSLRLDVLARLDLELYEPSGCVDIVEDPQLVVLSPIQGFALSEILTESIHRRKQWDQLQAQIPSMRGIPTMNEQVAQRLQLKVEQRQRLETMTSQGRTLQEVAYDLGRDPLEVAKMFANWIRVGLVQLKLNTSTSAQFTILAIDDSQAMQTMIRRSLPGFRVITTGSPAEGLSLVFQQKPDLIVLDLTMPDIDGLDVCRTIRESPQFKQIPIIILTARDKLVDRFRGKLVGADTYLTKPFEAETFRDTVLGLLKATVPQSEASVATAC